MKRKPVLVLSMLALVGSLGYVQFQRYLWHLKGGESVIDREVGMELNALRDTGIVLFQSKEAMDEAYWRLHEASRRVANEAMDGSELLPWLIGLSAMALVLTIWPSRHAMPNTVAP